MDAVVEIIEAGVLLGRFTTVTKRRKVNVVTSMFVQISRYAAVTLLANHELR